jgi:hypothetical protein
MALAKIGLATWRLGRIYKDMRSDLEKFWKLKLEKLESTKAILTDLFSARRVINIDEHVFIRVAGKVARKDLDKFLFVSEVGVHKTFSYEEPMRSFAAVEANPVVRPVHPALIEPSLVLRNARPNFLKGKIFSPGDCWEQHRE